MAKLTLTDIASGYNATAVVNANSTAIETAIENTLSRDGTSPNGMNAELDMNSHKITNLDAPSASTDAARWIDVTDAVELTGEAVPALTGNSQKYLGTDGSSLGWKNFWDQTSAEAAASVTPTAYKYMPGDFRRYGAVGDGSTNDTAAVTAAINQSLQSGGAVPFGQPGLTYLLSTWTTIDTTASFRLGGYGYTLKGPASTTNFLSFGGASLLCEYVTFDRWTTVFDRQSTDSGTTTLLQIEKNVFTNCTGLVINLERPISQYYINGNHIYSCTGGYGIRIGENTYASQDNWLKGEIVGNKIKDLTATGSTSAVGILVYGREVQIERNTIDTVTAVDGEAWGIYTKARYGVISGNIVRNIDSSTSTDIVGINVKGSNRITTTSPQGFSVVCQGNQVYSVGTDGADGNGIRAQTDDVLVVDNFVEDAGLLGIVVDDSAGSDNVTVSRNILRSSTGSANQVGIYIATSGTGHKVIGNTIENVEKSIRISSAPTGTLEDIIIADNTGTGASTALITIQPSDTLSGCEIRSNILTSGARGVLFNGGTVNNVRISDNDFDAASTAAIGGTIPTDIYIRHISKVQTTDGTQTSALSLTLPDESAYSIQATVTARQSTTAGRASYIRHGLVYRDGGGSATVQGSVTSLSAIEVDAAWDATVTVSGNTARVSVTGEAAKTVNWKAVTEVVGAA